VEPVDEVVGVEDDTDAESEDSSVACVEDDRYARGFVCVVTASREAEEVHKGTSRHITDMFKFEQTAMGEPEKWDALDEALQKQTTSLDDALPTEIGGSDNMQLRIRELLGKYRSCFRRTVAPKPALIKPMILKVDEAMWNSSRLNNNKPRPHTPKKNAEIDRQVELLKSLGVIQDSEALRYSHVHLVPKPGIEQWRFCLDYRYLNLCTQMEAGVIPLIHELLRDIGTKKPAYFAVIDFTSGYHQAPIEELSRKYTAFRTHRGIYEWLRVPMGLKGAPNYFQKEISTTVLGTLIGIICELYIDDLIIFGKTEEEFLINLEKVLMRLQDKNITCNPDKCRFGMETVEYLGRTIDRDGISVPKDKVEEVLTFALPTLLRDLQSFVGMVNYFADHLRDASTELGALRKFHENTKKSKQLQWTKEGIAQFNRIKELVNQLPKLHFIIDNGIIILYTDASDFGIGAYLAQVVDGKEQPIAFMSKALQSAEKDWSTIEKECYAIYYALRKFEHLLRDVKFTLYTDHKNLLYLNVPPSSKVLRWKLAIQEYDFDIVHLAGNKNIVADGMSRLIDDTPKEGTILNFVKEVKEGGLKPLSDDIFNKIYKVHNCWVGHRGIDATCKILRTQGVTWRGMRRDVEKFCRLCPTCQKQDVRQINYNTIPFTTSTYKPHARLNVDTISLSETDSHGNLHAIVIIDTCTR